MCKIAPRITCSHLLKLSLEQLKVKNLLHFWMTVEIVVSSGGFGGGGAEEAQAHPVIGSLLVICTYERISNAIFVEHNIIYT